MSEVTRWWWIRHAPVNSGGRIYGQDDLPADCSDDRLFAAVSARLPKGAVWITSNLVRTKQTADALRVTHDDRGLGLVEERLFAEQHFGDWQGLTHDELRAHRQPQWHRFWLAPAHEAPPGGESFEQLMKRVHEGLRIHSERFQGRDIVSVAHGGTIRAAIALALGITPERALAISVENVSLTQIDHFSGPDGSHNSGQNETWRVGLVNFLP